jgi:hypothetical protein
MLFSDKFERALDLTAPIGSMPSVFSGRGMTTSDVNTTVLERVRETVISFAGERAATNFVSMVAEVRNLSASNVILALSSLEKAEFEWNPAKHSIQQPFCDPNGKPPVLEPENAGQAFVNVTEGLVGKRRRPEATRYEIAGEFIEKYGTREQWRGLRDSSPQDSERGLPFGLAHG